MDRMAATIHGTLLPTSTAAPVRTVAAAGMMPSPAQAVRLALSSRT